MILKSLLVFSFLALLLLDPHCATANEPVRLQLKWQHQFQFAGYYAAIEKGYYQAAGLDVELIPGSPDVDPVRRVLDGNAEFGIGTTELLLSRQRGVPVVALAVIFQHSPLALVTLKKDGLQSIHDLDGRRIMLEPGSSELQAYLQKEQITADKSTPYSHAFHVQNLINGTVDAMSTYVTDEPFELNMAGKEYLLFSPRAAGIDFYGDNLFTTEQLIRQKPDVVRKFRKASLLGWEYAMQHPEELVQLIYARYSKRHSIEHLRFEAGQMKSLLQASLVEIGHMHPGRWRHIADTYAELGMMKPGFDLAGFLYDVHPPPPDLKRLYTIIGAVSAAIILVSVLAVYIHRINRRLALALEEKSRREERHRIIFQTSPSAGVVWREGFIITDWNHQAEVVFGWKREEVIGRRFVDFLLPATEVKRMAPELSQMVWEDILPHSINDNLTRDGRVIICEWFNAWLPEHPGDPREVVSLAIDITERKQAEQALAQLTSSLESLSITDSLTGLANRRHFDDVLHTEYGRHLRSGGELSLILLDIDHFKAFNDTYGHLKGDDCLREVGRVLRETVSRAADLPARYGGEEFACILPETDRNGAVMIAEQIRRGIEALAIPHSGSSAAAYVTASLGVVTAECVSGVSPQEILAQADELLYQAKASGRNRIQFVPHSRAAESMEEIGSGFIQLVWRDSFCSGNQLIDAQHQALFQAANELFSAILSGRTPQEIAPVIDCLLADVALHFEDERMILEKIAFPGLGQHLADHERLLARGGEMVQQFEAGMLTVGVLFQFLAYDMIMTHMLGADREYFPFV